ncbi:hypothetical protein [Pseudomonas sp. SLFW]|jgi:hypothetical protein|uniref:hypothetical protein n=1 Tax=Pseudomonas sp. SLFW TaxID=2683259 RepID=UPI00141233A7|nr:hypothetical protein [Pseudomonas sp. SLFW]NBB11035.1 hypothetical protein [Pseudomonas sp. SLFW]
MPRFRRVLTWLFAYPPTNKALFAIATWPVLFAIACWQTPQIAEFLSSYGLEVSMLQVFQAGLGAYAILLANHRALNRRHFKRNQVHIDRHRRLVSVERGMVEAGLTDTPAYTAVTNEKVQLCKRLGFLADADNFYRKLRSLIQVFQWLRNKLK